MSTLLDTFKTLKPWQISVLAAILVGAAGATYGVYALVSDSGQAGLSDDQQLIPAQVGNLVNQISTNGSLVYPVRETLTFGTQGTVEEVLVEEGQVVEEGQALARLDATTVASLERAAARARVDLRSAEEALAEAKDPHTSLDLAQAEAEVANANLSFRSAQETLDELKNGPVAEDISKAQFQVDAATATLASAEGEISLSLREWDGETQEAQEALDDAQEGYQGVFQSWLGIEVNEAEMELDPDTLLDSWGVDLASLFDPDLRFQDVNRGILAEGLSLDDPATPWSEAVLYTWLNFYPGTIAPTCENGVVLGQGVCIQKEMGDAWDAYQEAKDNNDAVQIQAAKAIVKAGDAVVQAEESLATAQEALTDVQDGPDALDVEVKEKQFAVAQANLAKAEEELAELTGSVDSLEVALRETDLASAQLALEEALQRLEGAALRAPMFGIVSIVDVDAGQSVNPNTPVFEIVDPTVIEVDGIVDEIDVLFVREGARAEVTMDALPGQTLVGTVSSIASAAQSQQGVVSYPIRIQVRVPEGVELREGLSATASIVIREESNVILLPLQALYGTFEQPVVRVMFNGRIEERPVVLGNSDDFWVAVREGLSEGEQVVMEASQAASTGFSFRDFRQFAGAGQFSGALPGGGSRGGLGGDGGRGQRPRDNRNR